MFGSIIGRGLGGGSTTGRFSSTPLSKGASLRFGNRSDRKASPGGSGVAVRQQVGSCCRIAVPGEEFDTGRILVESPCSLDALLD